MTNDPILLKALFNEVLSTGKAPTAATASIPAAKAYSTMSCARIFFQNLRMILFLSLICEIPEEQAPVLETYQESQASTIRLNT